MTNTPPESRDRGSRLLALRGRAGSGLLFHSGVWRLAFRRLGKNNALAMAAALSYQTIFALVPIIVLSLLVAKAMGQLPNYRAVLVEFMDRTGMMSIAQREEVEGRARDANAPTTSTAPATAPATQPVSRSVGQILLDLVDQGEQKLTVGKVGPIGGVLLIWAAVSLLSTMEDSLNRTFGAERSRSVIRRIIIYWFVVSLSPVLYLTAAFASRKAMALLHVAGGNVLAWIVAILGWLQPLLVGVLLLTAVYAMIPNTRVRVRTALYGAAVAFPLWLVAKWAFQLYVVKVVVESDPVYGALGLIPLFLMWLNFSWLLFLLGAELAHTAQNLGRLISAEQAERRVLGTWDLMATAVAVAREFATAKGPAVLSRLAEDLQLPPVAVSKLMDRLTGAGIMVAVEGGAEQAYVPARALDRILPEEIMSIGVRDAEGEAQPVEGIARIVARVRQAAGEGLKDKTMADLVRE